LTVDSIQVNDCATFRVMVSIGALLFILAHTATGVLYGLVDPPVRLG
jgi:ABC-type dipeptide/oligopeptide/nickel transport system permease component